MLTQSQQDASFYGLVSGLLNQQEDEPDQVVDADGQKPWTMREESADDRRGFGRRSFACPQLVAPYDGKELPAQASFRLVDCIDICSSGFSFLTDKIPDQQYLVIALGTVPFAFVTAEVLHIQRQEDNPAEPFRVGCQFLKRIPSKWTS